MNRDDTWMAKLGTQDAVKEDVLSIQDIRRAAEILYSLNVPKLEDANFYIWVPEETQTHKERVEPKP